MAPLTRYSLYKRHVIRERLTSCGMSPASNTKLVSAAVNTLVLLRIYPYMSRAVSPRSSVPDLSIWPMTRLDTLP